MEKFPVNNFIYDMILNTKKAHKLAKYAQKGLKTYKKLYIYLGLIYN
jgi:hypothetical protein